jgi:hypothetical protein
MIHKSIWNSGWNENDRRKVNNSEKPCPSATLSTTNPILTDLGMKLGFHSEKLKTNHLSHGMASSAHLALLE